MFVNVFSSPILAISRIFFAIPQNVQKLAKHSKKRSKAFQTRSNTQSNASLDPSKNQPTLQNFKQPLFFNNHFFNNQII